MWHAGSTRKIAAKLTANIVWNQPPCTLLQLLHYITELGGAQRVGGIAAEEQPAVSRAQLLRSSWCQPLKSAAEVGCGRIIQGHCRQHGVLKASLAHPRRLPSGSGVRSCRASRSCLQSSAALTARRGRAGVLTPAHTHVPTTRQGAARLAPTPSLTCERVAHQVRLLHGAHWPHPMLLAAVAEHHLRHNKFLEKSWHESQVLAQPSLLSTSAGALAAGALTAGQERWRGRGVHPPGSGGAALAQSRRPCCPCRRLVQRRNLWEPALQLRNRLGIAGLGPTMATAGWATRERRRQFVNRLRATADLRFTGCWPPSASWGKEER